MDRLHQILHVMLLFLNFSSAHFSHASEVLYSARLSGEWEDGTFPWSAVIEENTSLILASERTKRKDPTNFYNYYRGGWNISDEHYWTSAASSAVPVFFIAISWLMGFGILLLIFCCCSCFCRRRRYSYSRSGFVFSRIVLIIVTGASLIGCIMLYINQGKFHNSTVTMLDHVKGQSRFIANNLQNFSSDMTDAKNISVHQVFLHADLQAKVGATVRKVVISADELSSRTSMNLRNIDNFLKNVRIDLIIGSAVMLILVILGLIFSILGLEFLVYCLVLIGWILIAGAFILCGVLVLLHTVVGDTCIAMDEWILQPQAGTALDDILPCVDAAIVTESLLRNEELTSKLINVVNDVIVNVSNANSQSLVAPLNYNQSGPLIPLLCNPYKPDFALRKCSPGEVSFEDAPQVWKGFICNTEVVSGKEICSTVGRITPSIYLQMTAATGMSRSLYQYNPFLVKLANCSFARETFSLIDTDYCPGLELYSKRMYFSLTAFSCSVMISLVFWMAHVGETRRRKYRDLFFVHGGQPAFIEENIL